MLDIVEIANGLFIKNIFIFLGLNFWNKACNRNFSCIVSIKKMCFLANQLVFIASSYSCQTIAGTNSFQTDLLTFFQVEFSTMSSRVLN